LRDLGYGEVRSVSAGRYFQLTIAAASRDAAEVRATEMCDRLLAIR
jgi:phosphoribosylformylglycinamidine synthase PurS subunit